MVVNVTEVSGSYVEQTSEGSKNTSAEGNSAPTGPNSIQLVGEIIYPNYNNNNINEPTKMLSFAKPRELKESGIYIWLTQDGIWNIQQIPEYSSILSGLVSSEGEIKVVGLDRTSDSESNKFNLSGLSSVQFYTKGLFIEFNLSYEGIDATRNMFIGSIKLNPKTTQFRLSNPKITNESERVIPRITASQQKDRTRNIDNAMGGGSGKYGKNN